MLDFLSSSFLGESVSKFVHETGFAQLFLQEGGYKYLIMIAVGCFFLYLAIKHKFEPMLLVPIGFGIIIGNIPMVTGHGIGIYEEGSVLNYLYFGVRYGVYPPLIFLGVGAMTDFSSLISNPKLMLIGAAAQIGIFAAYMGALALGFPANEAGSIAIIGGADGPTAIFLTSRLAPEYMGAIAICAYSYMALVPVIQPPVMRLLTSSRERLIKMRPPRAVSSTEKILFPIIGFLLTTFVVPDAIPLLGMLFLGNLLKESGVVKRLATTASNQLIDIMTILIGITVGASTQASVFLTPKTLGIFVLGACSFFIATMGGVLFVKLMNLFLKEGNKINPLIGNAGVSAVPAAARVSQDMGIRYDRSNYLLMHAMGPNVAGVVGSAVAAGILLSFLGLGISILTGTASGPSGVKEGFGLPKPSFRATRRSRSFGVRGRSFQCEGRGYGTEFADAGGGGCGWSWSCCSWGGRLWLWLWLWGMCGRRTCNFSFVCFRCFSYFCKLKKRFYEPGEVDIAGGMSLRDADRGGRGVFRLCEKAAGCRWGGDPCGAHREFFADRMRRIPARIPGTDAPQFP